MLKNITKISSGTLIGQMISFVTLPIFTRIYGATIIGNWTMFNSVATIVNSFSDLGLSNAIMVEENESDSKNLFSIITTLGVLFSVLIGFGSYLYYSKFQNLTEISPLFYAIVLAVLIFSQQQIQLCYSWLNKRSLYNVLMKNPIVNNISIAVIAIPLGFLGFTQYGYYLGLIAGQVITLIHMKRFVPRTLLNFKFRNYLYVFKKYNKYIKYQMPSYVLAQVKNQTPSILIRGYFGATILGYYSISQRILGIPINLLANAIGKVYYQTIVDINKNGQNIGEFTLKNITRAMRLALLPMICIMGFGDIFCVLFFGEGYYVAGNIIRIVSFMTYFTFLMLATQGITIVIRKQKYSLYSAIVQVVGYFVALSLGKYIFNSIYFACAFMTFAFCLVQILYFYFIFRSCKINPFVYVKELVFNLVILISSVAVIRFVLFMLGIVTNI